MSNSKPGMNRYSAKDDSIRRDVQKYTQWLHGQDDRKQGNGCLSASGKYLDGWYNPDQIVPDFLTVDRLIECKAYMRHRQESLGMLLSIRHIRQAGQSSCG